LLGKSFTSTAPATVYVRLHNSTVNDSITAATDQLAGTAANYAQVAVTNSSASWTNSTAGGSKTNKITITFTTAASTGWGTVNAFSISATNSTTTGDIIYWGDLTSPQAISAGNVVRFSTGAIVISED
jgi:hypothetical protein